MLMHPQTALLVGIFAPLVTAILVPFLAVRSNWRDIAGPVGAIVTFVAALDVARAVLGGGTPSWTAVELAPGIELGFRVTPLGAIFGLVASGLWILAAIYSVAICGAIMKSARPVCRLLCGRGARRLAIMWSSNLLCVYFCEVLTFSTFPLVTHKEARRRVMPVALYPSCRKFVVLLLPAVVYIR